MSLKPAVDIRTEDSTAHTHPYRDEAKTDIMEKPSQEVSGDEKGESTGSAPPSVPKLRFFLLILSLVLSVFVVGMDNFIIAPALPIIAVDLSANDASYAWIESSLLLSSAVAVPIFGRISDFLGRRSVIICANIFFFAGTLVGGFAVTTAMMIVGRVVQGIGCGGLLVMANICIADLFGPRDRSAYLSILATFTAIASATGPVIGGALTTKATWRWCFWINLPIAAFAFAFLVAFLDIPSPQRGLSKGLKEMDWFGSFMIITATVLLLVGLQLGGVSYPWRSPAVILLIAIGGLCFIVFFSIEGFIIKRPLIPLRIFQTRSRVATLGAMFSQAVVTTGGKIFLPLYYQLVLGVSALESAVYFLPFAVTISLILPLIGYAIKRTGKYRLIICVGSSLISIGAGLLIDSKSYTDWVLIVVPQILLAIGQGLTYQSPLIAFQAQTSQQDIAAAQSAYQFLRTFSQMVSVILGQVILQAQTQRGAAALLHTDIQPSLLQAISSGNVISATVALQSLPTEQRNDISQVLAGAFGDMWIFYTAFSALGFISSFLVKDVEMR